MALCLVSKESEGGLLSLKSLVPCGTDVSGNPIFYTTENVLAKKHPAGRPDTLLDPTIGKFVVFEIITGVVIKCVALHTLRAAGPSGVAANA